MPSTCFVPGCKGNYNSQAKKVGSYMFPRDERLRKRWVEAVRRKECSIKKYSRVCEHHFKKSDFETETSAYDPKTGITLTAPLLRKRLKKGVIPSLLLPTSDSLSPDKRTSSKLKKKLNQSIEVQNKLQCVPAKTSILKDTAKTTTPASRLAKNKAEEKSEEMVKRKRKSATNEASNKKVDSSSKLKNTNPSNGVHTSEKPAAGNSKGRERPVCTNPEAFAFLEVQVKKEPLSDEETPSGPSRNNPDCTTSENMQITNVKSLSSESVIDTPSEEENTTKKSDESFDNNFYSKPLDMDQRDKAFGSFVACELSDLRANPILYMKTKESILKILTEAHFEQMSKKS